MTKQRRATARRKARQVEAVELLRQINPAGAVVITRLGTPIPITSINMLSERSKQKLIEGFEQVRHRKRVRRW